MEVKKAMKEDVKRLKKIAHYAQDWAAKIQTSFELTQEMCTHATKTNFEGCDNFQDLEALLSEAREAISTSAKEVAVLAVSRSSEVIKEVEKKGLLNRYSKTSPYSQGDIQQKVQHARVAVGLALFDALQVQARELDRVALKSMSLVTTSTSQGTTRVSAPLTPTAQNSNRFSEGHWSDDGTELCHSTPGGEQCDIDWDGFEQDLEAMSAVVHGGSVNTAAKALSPGGKIYAGHELTVLREYMKETEMERDDALRRAQESEAALTELKRQHESLIEESKRFYTEGDVQELQRALKREQMNCLTMESDLRLAKATARAAEDEAQATQFALVVAQQVAEKIAIDGGVQRRWTSDPSSPLQAQSHTQARAPATGSGARSRSSGTLGNDHSDLLSPTPERNIVTGGQRHEGTENDYSDNQQEDVVASTAATRSDSAFMAHPENTESQGVPPATDLAQDLNAAPAQSSAISPNMSADLPAESRSPANEFDMNPFLVGQENTGSWNVQHVIPEEEKLESTRLSRASSSPAQAPKRRIHERLSVSARDTEMWNPFEEPDVKNSPVVGGHTTKEMSRSALNAQHPERDNEAWNPFGSSLVSPVKSPLTKRSPSDPVGSGAGWNPFSPDSQVTSTPDIEAVQCASPTVMPEEGSSKQDWNPFDSSSSRPERSDQWNPFSGVTAAPAVKNEKESEWNPFVANN